MSIAYLGHRGEQIREELMLLSLQLARGREGVLIRPWHAARWGRSNRGLEIRIVRRLLHALRDVQQIVLQRLERWAVIKAQLPALPQCDASCDKSPIDIHPS